ncbi:MAG TPA: glycosyltransferase [Longimicrobiales bacterium]|nr:glycosyltransferase [Longimicrobiales bacterium]
MSRRFELIADGFVTGDRSSGHDAADAGPGPRISVVMSVFNGERYLQEAIDSILRQRYRDFEFIIIDDASKDSTAAILGRCDDPRIRVLRNSANRGLAESLNRGLAVARGEFIARQDADDISEPDRLGAQVAFLDAHPDVALLGSAHTEIDAEGGVLAQVDANCDHVTILWAMLFYCPFAHTAVMFRRQPVLEAVGVYDASFRYSMDYEYWTRIAARFRVANLAEPLVRLRFHERSMTATYGSDTLEGHRLQVQAVAALLPAHAGGTEGAEATHRLLSALMFGPPAEFPADQLLRAVDLMLELQQAFARARQLSPEERAHHRAALRSHLFNALLEFARADADSGRGGRAVRRLVQRAAGLDPGRLRQPRMVLSLTALLARHYGFGLGGRLVGRAIRALPSRRHRAEPTDE